VTLGPISVNEVSIVTLLVLVIFTLLTGIMVPGWWHRKAIRQLEERSAVQDATIEKLLDVSETFQAVLTAIRSTAETNRQDTAAAVREEDAK
jgi:uncharacterized coiled-coil protein SlyX